MSKIACQNCGAVGAIGSVCEFCGSTISSSGVPAVKRRRRKTPSNDAQYSKSPYDYFWNRLTCDPYVPDDIFDSFYITAVYEFWIPAFLWRESLTCKDRKTHIEVIRQWAVDRSFEDELPDNYPKSEKIDVCIIDFEYKGGKFWYIYFESDGSDLPMYPKQLKYYRSMSSAGGPKFFILDDKIGLSDELSDFPPGWEAMKQEALKQVEKERCAIKNAPFKPFIAYSTIGWMVAIGIILCKFYYISYFLPILGVFICLLAVGAIFDNIGEYKKHLKKVNDADITYNSRAKIIKAGQYRDYIMEFCKEPKYSREKRERGYWAYRKANPTPISSCQNYYKI